MGNLAFLSTVRAPSNFSSDGAIEFAVFGDPNDVDGSYVLFDLDALNYREAIELGLLSREVNIAQDHLSDAGRPLRFKAVDKSGAVNGGTDYAGLSVKFQRLNSDYSPGRVIGVSASGLSRRGARSVHQDRIAQKALEGDLNSLTFTGKVIIRQLESGAPAVRDAVFWSAGGGMCRLRDDEVVADKRISDADKALVKKIMELDFTPSQENVDVLARVDASVAARFQDHKELRYSGYDGAGFDSATVIFENALGRRVEIPMLEVKAGYDQGKSVDGVSPNLLRYSIVRVNQEFFPDATVGHQDHALG